MGLRGSSGCSGDEVIDFGDEFFAAAEGAWIPAHT